MLEKFLSLLKSDIKVFPASNNFVNIEIINNKSVCSKTVKEIFTIISELGNNLEIDLTNLKISNTFIFFEGEDFFNRFNLNKETFDKSNLVIISESNDYIVKSINEEFTEEKKVFFNYLQYKYFLSRLKNIESFKKIISNDNEFILVSRANSVMHIGYYNNDKRIVHLDNLEHNIEELLIRFEKFPTVGNSIENEEYIRFFIENISTIGIVNTLKKDRLYEILKELKVLIAITDRDYDNYIKDFSFEKIKSKFKEERNKYFENIEKNLESINKQVLSYPLTFGATAFASYQVKEKPFILFLIFISFLLYTIIATKALNISSFNLNCLEKDVINEEEKIKNTFNKNHDFFKDDFDKIHTKIEKIKSLSFILKFVFYTILIMFSLFIFSQTLSTNDSNKIDKVTIPIDKIKVIETT